MGVERPSSGETLSKSGPALVERRPSYGSDQITSISQIKVGESYIRVGVGRESVITILSKPFEGENGSWWVRAVPEGQQPYKQDFLNLRSLADMGVTPYIGGDGRKFWNPTYYLRRRENGQVESRKKLSRNGIRRRLVKSLQSGRGIQVLMGEKLN